jgi:hypothetical protein
VLEPNKLLLLLLLAAMAPATRPLLSSRAAALTMGIWKKLTGSWKDPLKYFTWGFGQGA